VTAASALPLRDPAPPAALRAAVAPDRAVLALSGPDRAGFLQGLVSNDVTEAGPHRAVYATLLTPQGRFLHEMTVVDDGERLLLEVEAARRADLLRRLGLYKLRSKIELADADGELVVVLVTGPGAAAALGLGEAAGSAGPVAGGTGYVDPRLAALGARILLPRSLLGTAVANVPLADDSGYEALRLAWGVPDGGRDLEPEKALLLENNIDLLAGISWTKGCYMGQELTARTRYRGLVKKRLLPAEIDGAVPEPGTLVEAAGREVGEVRSGGPGRVLALLRIAELEQAVADRTPLTAGGTVLRPYLTSWIGTLSRDTP
jgi:folate-binding protein YgfZ